MESHQKIRRLVDFLFWFDRPRPRSDDAIRRRDSTTDDGRDVGGPTANMRVFAHERAESRARRGDLGENARDR